MAVHGSGRQKRGLLTKFFPVHGRDILITILFLSIATGISMLLRYLDEEFLFTSMIFILAVFLISRFTDGYLFGILSSLISVLLVNYIFTFPYYEFNFTLAGYPLTICCMLAVAIVTSMMTTQIKSHSQVQLEAEKEKTRSNLLRAVSHDLRTPLTSIMGASSAILENDAVIESTERKKLLSEINEDAQWLLRMVENLLSITKIDGEQRARIIKTPEAAEEMIAEAVTKFNKRFPMESVTVKVPDKLLLIPMDAILIEQVIINLLENVVIHSQGADKINLSVLEENGEAVFEVKDNGIGIAKEVLPHIFEGYFSQSYEDEGDTRKNMGIGLSVCNTIIQAHQGKMTADNRRPPEHGAIFRFTLPLEKEDIYGK